MEIRFTKIGRNRSGTVGTWAVQETFCGEAISQAWPIVGPELFNGELRLSADPVPAYLIGAMLMTQKLEDSIGAGAPLERTATEVVMKSRQGGMSAVMQLWSKKLTEHFYNEFIKLMNIGDKQQ